MPSCICISDDNLSVIQLLLWLLGRRQIRGWIFVCRSTAPVAQPRSNPSPIKQKRHLTWSSVPTMPTRFNTPPIWLAHWINLVIRRLPPMSHERHDTNVLATPPSASIAFQRNRIGEDALLNGEVLFVVVLQRCRAAGASRPNGHTQRFSPDFPGSCTNSTIIRKKSRD